MSKSGDGANRYERDVIGCIGVIAVASATPTLTLTLSSAAEFGIDFAVDNDCLLLSFPALPATRLDDVMTAGEAGGSGGRRRVGTAGGAGHGSAAAPPLEVDRDAELGTRPDDVDMRGIREVDPFEFRQPAVVDAAVATTQLAAADDEDVAVLL